jgi:hypothetical protein
MHSASNIFQ